MGRNTYISLILTVIALELLVLIFEAAGPEKKWIDKGGADDKLRAFTAGYKDSRPVNPAETIDVRIMVAIGCRYGITCGYLQSCLWR
jgi:hypothetical protein